METMFRYVVSEEMVEWKDIEAKGRQWDIPYHQWPTNALEEHVRYVYGLDTYLPDGADHEDWQRVEYMEWELHRRTIRATESERLQDNLSYLSQHAYPTWDRDADGLIHGELAFRGLLCLYDCVPF